MAAGQGVVDTIVIDDFTPGIISDYASTSSDYQQPAKDGSARVTDTYSCLAGPRGGLIPSFGTDGSVTDTLLDTAGRYHPGHPYMRIIGSLNVSPVRYASPGGLVGGLSGWNVASSDDLTHPDSLFIMYQSFYDQAGAGTNWRVRCAVRNYAIIGSGTPKDTVYNFIGTDNNPYVASQLFFGCGAVLSIDGIGDQKVAFLHSFEADDAANEYNAHAQVSTLHVGAAPATVIDPNTDFQPFGQAISHQGRVVCVNRNSGLHYGLSISRVASGVNVNYGLLQTNNFFGFSNFRSMSPSSTWNPNAVQFDQEYGWGITCMHSISANELLLIKHRGGGLLVRGDVANPSVTRLPSLPEGLNAANIGVTTPIGFVFGTRRGVYVYQGGDQAQKLSPNLDGWFWKPASQTLMFDPQPYGKFAFFDPYIIAPNNWCMDTRTGAWMRYFPTPDLVGAGNGGRIFPYAEPSASDSFYALPAGISNSTTNDSYNTTCAQRFTPGGGTLPAWSWRSQPLIRTRGRRIKVREVTILAQAPSTTTIEVTLYGYKQGTPTTQQLGTYTFTVPAAGRPVQLTHPFNVGGGDIEVKIKTNGPATLYRISLGYNEGATAHV